MRRQLNWLVLAVTGLVVIAFVIPLGLLVRRQAEERAQISAEQRAQASAAALAVAIAGAEGTVSVGVAESALVAEVSIVLPDGTRVGAVDPSPDLSRIVSGGTASSMELSDGSWQVGLPVATSRGMVAVIAEAGADEMGQGVWLASGLLAALALALVAGSVWLADRLGRSLVQPSREMAEVANRLARGDLTARAAETGPPEVRQVAAALNGLAIRLEAIIEGERQALADLSHRLRTPLTALRLEAERFGAGGPPDAILGQVERTQHAVDELIREVRDRGKEQPAATDVVDLVESRLAFWAVLAEDEGRMVEMDLTSGPLMVEASPGELAAAFDAVLGNVFQHTPPGTGFSVTVSGEGGSPVVVVSDDGPGFPDVDVAQRGVSSAGSTGLGLDIALSLCLRLGGVLTTGEGPTGGALVTMELGPGGH